MNDWLTVREVADALGLTPDAVYNLIRRKRRPLKAVRVVTMGLRVHRDEVERFRRENVCPRDLAQYATTDTLDA